MVSNGVLSGNAEGSNCREQELAKRQEGAESVCCSRNRVVVRCG